MNSVKKTIAYFLSGLVLLFCILAILGIWEVIDMEDLIEKMFKSIMVILASAAVIVFVFAMLFRENRKNYDED